jgi:MFS family permease
MVLADLGAGLATIALAILYFTGNLQIWHLAAAGAFAGIFESFQFPAFSASISVMLKKEQYARANGLLSLAESASGIIAPVLAGALLAFIGLGGVMLIDIVTFLLAVLAVLVVVIPQPPRTAEGAEGRGNLWVESVYGFRYIWARASLLGLQTLFFFSNLFGSIAFTIQPAMILARTGNDAATLGLVQSAMGVGGVVGGLAMSTWGGPKRRIHGLLLGFIGLGLLGEALMGIGQSLPVWLVAGFFTLFFMPFLNGANQAIWQAKVAPDVQGRVFAARRLIAQITAPIGILLGGFLADRVFEPMMRGTGPGATLFAPLVGTGPGAGMGLLMVFVGVAGAIVGAAGYLVSVIRNAEDLLPDHIAALEEAQPPSEPAFSESVFSEPVTQPATEP